MADTTPILSAMNLRKSFLERMILDDVSFAIHGGERVALMGANGAGKSTLLAILAGKMNADGGEVRMRRGLHVSSLVQQGALRDDWTVGQTIDDAFAEVRELEAALERIHVALEKGEGDLMELLEQQSAAQHRLDERHPHTIGTRTDRVMAALGVPSFDRVIGQLSGGERRRTALCRTLLEDGDLLLLDEPTNHLDAETLDWLEDYLAALRGTVVFVTHDRYFLDNVATTMLELWRGRAKVYQGNYTDYLATKEEEFARGEKAEATRQNLLRREMEWMRRQPRARTTKSKARIDRVNLVLADKPLEPDPLVNLVIPGGPRLGTKVIEADKISYTIGGRKLIDKFTHQFGAGERIGIVGRNGLGKTTLIRLLLKEVEPDSGTVVHGPSVKAVYADQERTALDLEKTVLDEVAAGAEWITVGGRQIGFRAWLRAFLFNEETAAMPIRLLSGGERNRVLLAKMLRGGGNVVVMDEPTNDLDLPTLRILEEALAVFTGCAFVVSHDRYFLNRIATRILAFRGNGEIVSIAGNYDDYLLWLKKEEDREPTPVPVQKAEKPAVSDAPPAQIKKKKLSFNEQRELATLDQRMAAADAKVAEFDKRIADPATYTKLTREQIHQLHIDADAARTEAEQLLERWMELSERA